MFDAEAEPAGTAADDASGFDEDGAPVRGRGHPAWDGLLDTAAAYVGAFEGANDDRARKGKRAVWSSE